MKTTAKLQQLLDILTPLVPNAKDHISREFVISDGIAAQSLNDGSRSSDSTSTVERTIAIRAELLEQMYQINDDLDTVEKILESCIRTCRKAITTRTPTPEQPRCYIDPGLAGYDTPLSDGGFHDPTCTNFSRTRKPAPCNTCRVRIDRYRARHDEKPLADDRHIEHDSIVDITTAGVAHARPIRGAA